MKNVDVSIIVPVYNAALYLDRCIQSILAQTYGDFELILIDDGSTDDSGVICDQYQKRDNRIKVFNKRNGGVSSARNLGLKNAIGDWIVFIDSDDWVETSYLSSLYNNTYYSDLICCSFQYEKGDKIVVKELVNGSISLNALILDNILTDAAYTVPWAKMYRKEIIDSHQIYFDDQICFGEDTLFVYTYLLYASKIETVNANVYHYCIQGEGLSNRKVNPSVGLYTLDCFYELLLKYADKYPGYDVTKRFLWLVYDFFIGFISDPSNVNKKQLRIIVENKHIRALLQDSRCFPKGIKRKLWDFLALNRFYGLLAMYVRLYKYD